MKKIKNLLYCLLFLAVIMIAAYNTTLNKKSTDMAKLTLANVTTLANAESSSSELWNRNDEDCVYTFSGQAHAEITIFGTIKIKLDGNGEATYTVSAGKTHCSANGNEQCTARYCPVAINN
jgi:hypothetical protein